VTSVPLARGVRALLCLQAVLLGSYLMLLLLPQQVVPSGLRDNLIGNAVLVLPTICVLLRGGYVRRDRTWSWCFAAGMAAFTAGNIEYVNHVQYLDPAPYPSVADLGFLGLYPLVAIGLVAFVRRGTFRLRRSMLLDGLVACLGAAAVAGAFVVAPLVAQSTRSANGSWAQIAAGAAYPVADSVIVAMVVGVFVLHGGRPGFYGWIAAGLATFAVADTLYVYRVASGTYQVGTPLDALWAVGLNVLAVGVWWPRRDTGYDRVRNAWALAAPVLSVVLAVGVLVRASVHQTPLAIVLLAAATLLAATGRIVDGFLTVMDYARVRVEARTDDLTGIGNRRLLYEAIDAGLDRLTDGDGLHLLLIDLDRFKEINDSLGHAAGDEVLVTVANRLASAAEPGDVLARIGGDEFAILLTGRSARFDAVETARRAAAAIAPPVLIAGLALQIRASIGIGSVPVDALDRTDLMRHADIAMYDAKVSRSGTARYDSARDDHSRERLLLVGELRDAFAHDPDQLVVHYQPKCTLTGETVGAEALVRWQHPTHGLLFPDAFVPIAENNSLMPTLTRHVLHAALAECRRWRRQAPTTTVAVNLSVTSLLDQSLVADVMAAIAAAGVPADALVLEITETMIMLDPDRSQRTLEALRAYGVLLAVDDYGTGHCSLAYLRDLPVQELKLDRSFVRDIAIRPRDAAIVRSTIELAHSLGLVLVAEGVEDRAAAELLRAMGCDLAQGYYFGRPLPAAEALAVIAATGSPQLTQLRPVRR
jgi:diguanylate cyclase (GGDEF)-like protein